MLWLCWYCPSKNHVICGTLLGYCSRLANPISHSLLFAISGLVAGAVSADAGAAPSLDEYQAQREGVLRLASSNCKFYFTMDTVLQCNLLNSFTVQLAELPLVIGDLKACDLWFIQVTFPPSYPWEDRHPPLPHPPHSLPPQPNARGCTPRNYAQRVREEGSWAKAWRGPLSQGKRETSMNITSWRTLW